MRLEYTITLAEDDISELKIIKKTLSRRPNKHKWKTEIDAEIALFKQNEIWAPTNLLNWVEMGL